MAKIKLSQIKPNPNNPRIIKDDKFKKLVHSLQEFPEMMEKRPLVCVTDVDGKMYPLGGNMRLKAMQELKLKDIPSTYVMMADDWTEEKRREFVIKDNIGYGEWDWDMIADNWEYDILNDWGMDIPGFGMNGEFNEHDEYNFQNKVTVEFKTTEEAQVYFEKVTKDGLKAKMS